MYRAENRTPTRGGLKSPVSQAFSLSSYCPQIRQKSPCSHDRMMNQSFKSPSRGTPKRNENSLQDFDYVKTKAQSSRPSTPRKEVKPPRIQDRVLDAPDVLLEQPAQLVDISEHDDMAVILGSTVYIWSDGQVQELVTTSQPPTAICWSGEKVIIACDGQSELWDARTGRVICSYEASHGFMTSSIKVSGNQLATGGHDGLIHIYDVRQPSLRHRIKAHKGAVCGLGWSPDGSMLASSGTDKCVNIIGTKHARMPQDEVACGLTWMDNGILLIGDEAGTIKMYNAWSNEQVKTLETNKPISALSWGKDWGIFSAHKDYDGTWCLWNKDLSGPCITENPSHHQAILNMATNESGDMVVTISEDETLRMCNLTPAPSTPVKSPLGRSGMEWKSPRCGSQFNVIRSSPALMR